MKTPRSQKSFVLPPWLIDRFDAGVDEISKVMGKKMDLSEVAAVAIYRFVKMDLKAQLAEIQQGQHAMIEEVMLILQARNREEESAGRAAVRNAKAREQAPRGKAQNGPEAG